MAAAKRGAVKKSGKFRGKSNRFGGGGRAAQLKARGMKGPLIGHLYRKALARRKAARKKG